MDLVLTFTGGLTAALLCGLGAHRLKLPPVVGYLVAGIAVGPFTPGFVAQASIATQFAEIGIILLLFGVGLNFHVKELLSVRQVAIPGALLAIVCASGLGALAAGRDAPSAGGAVVFGLAIAITSTVVLLRVLSDAGLLATRAGHIAVGWLVVEDLVTVLIVVLLPSLSDGQSNPTVWSVTSNIGVAIVKVAALLGVTLVIGKRAVPALLGLVARTQSRELFTLSVLVIALGIAVGAAKVFGASMALGAFLAGMVVGQSTFSTRAAAEAHPLKDAFAVLFFVSVGMLFDPSALPANAMLIAKTLAVVVVAKPLVVFALMRMLRQPFEVALTTALSLSQIGEFSFVIAELGRGLGLLSNGNVQVIVVASMASITLNPFILRLAGPLARRLSRPSQPASSAEALGDGDDDGRYHAIVVGYGPVGSTLTRLLTENGLVPTVIELNHETVTSLRARGMDAVYGDAGQIDVLSRAGAKTATHLIFAASGASGEAVIRAARELNPEIRVLSRSTYIREVASSTRAGAEIVVAAEAEVALAMTEHLLRDLGATGEQLDRERERVRRELGESSSRG